jgi:hypothetical protein
MRTDGIRGESSDKASTNLTLWRPFGAARDSQGCLAINVPRTSAASRSNSRRWAGIVRRLSAGCAASLVSLCCVVLAAPAFAQSGSPAQSQQLPEGYLSFMGDVEAQLGERYGDAWITWQGDAAFVHVGIVDPTAEEIADIVAQAPPSLVVEVVPVQYSVQQLDAYLEQLKAIAIPHGGEVVAIGARSELNKVEAVVTSADLPVVDEMRAAIPEDALLITVDPDAAFSTLPGRARSRLAWPVVPILVVGLAGVVILAIRRLGRVRCTNGVSATVPPEKGETADQLVRR